MFRGLLGSPALGSITRPPRDAAPSSAPATSYIHGVDINYEQRFSRIICTTMMQAEGSTCTHHTRPYQTAAGCAEFRVRNHHVACLLYFPSAFTTYSPALSFLTVSYSHYCRPPCLCSHMRHTPPSIRTTSDPANMSPTGTNKRPLCSAPCTPTYRPQLARPCSLKQPSSTEPSSASQIILGKTKCASR